MFFYFTGGDHLEADVQIDDQANFVRISLCFGITVATLAQTLGHVSGIQSQNFKSFMEPRNRFQADAQIDDQANFVRISLCFGITVATLAQTLGHVSGIQSKNF